MKTKAFINGSFIDSKTGKTFPVFNPANNEKITEVTDCSVEDVQEAIDSAEMAFPSWSARSAQDRSNLLRKWFELILENQEELGRLLALEQGKPFPEAKGEIAYGASFIEWFAEEAKRVYGDTIPGHQSDKRIFVIKQPIGVVAAITPWNFPNAMITRKIAPALAAGCTVIVKPSEDTPLSALALAELAMKAGFPKGVLNIVPTSQVEDVGLLLCESPIIRKISFTGSTEVGKILMKQSASTLKKLSLELGGNAPFIVMDDADVDAAVAGAIASKYRNAGQTCVCANRIFVQEKVYDEFVSKFSTAVALQKVGSAFEEGVTIGPLINQEALNKVKDLVFDAQNLGGIITTGGNAILGQGNGCYYSPTVIANATINMKIAQDEIFGPVAPIFKFQTDEEVIRLANNTKAGLAAYFYGNHYRRIWIMAEALEYGIVGINTGLISTTVAPFGGMKESGFGKEGSKYGIEEYVTMKYICMDM